MNVRKFYILFLLIGINTYVELLEALLVCISTGNRTHISTAESKKKRAVEIKTRATLFT